LGAKQSLPQRSFCINSKHNRDQIIDFLRKELIGPDPVPPFVQSNGEEILITDPPRLRYGAGILFPQKTIAEVSTDPSSAEATGLESEMPPADV